MRAASPSSRENAPKFLPTRPVSGFHDEKKRAAYCEALAKQGTQDSHDSALKKPFFVPVDARGTELGNPANAGKL